MTVGRPSSAATADLVRSGRTAVVVTVDNTPAGVLGLVDTVRLETSRP